MSADELLDKNTDKKQPRQKICAWLHQLLHDGPILVNEIRESAEQMGYSWSTVIRAKKDELIKSEKIGFGPGSKFQWRRPTPEEYITAINEAEKDAPQVADGGAIAEERQF